MTISRSCSLAAATAMLLAGCAADRVAAPAATMSPEWKQQQREAAAWLAHHPDPVVPPLTYVDGKPLTRENSDPGYNGVNPERIASIRVLRGAEAEALAGRPVPNGLIWITTKPAGSGH